MRSVGDGIVEEAQYKSNNGNYVKIRHNGTYTTGYLHMSKIASGIKPGTWVHQGETIGVCKAARGLQPDHTYVIGFGKMVCR
ncbi:MAG: M23 family metallopeptidase [Cytophagales bacterium]|nr:M23 family metallopeptidase [Cytophagales bacterium]